MAAKYQRLRDDLHTVTVKIDGDYTYTLCYASVADAHANARADIAAIRALIPSRQSIESAVKKLGVTEAVAHLNAATKQIEVRLVTTINDADTAKRHVVTRMIAKSAADVAAIHARHLSDIAARKTALAAAASAAAEIQSIALT